MTAFWIILIIVFALFAWLMIGGAEAAKKQKEELSVKGFDVEKTIEVGKYLGGHPDIDKAESGISLIPRGDGLQLMKLLSITGDIELGEIPNNNITNVRVEDASTVEKSVTVGRLLLIGVFAFAAKKKKKNELAYLIISWNDGRFDHDTIFEFSNLKPFEQANSARNKIIKLIR